MGKFFRRFLLHEGPSRGADWRKFLVDFELYAARHQINDRDKISFGGSLDVGCMNFGPGIAVGSRNYEKLRVGVKRVEIIRSHWF